MICKKCKKECHNKCPNGYCIKCCNCIGKNILLETHIDNNPILPFPTVTYPYKTINIKCKPSKY